MAHPYREPPPAERARASDSAIALPTVIFGALCAIGGFALGGPACGLVATIFGVALLLSPGGTSGWERELPSSRKRGTHPRR